MNEYFEAEMRLLQDAAREFAEAHPEQARMLNLGEVSDRDPYIERLLEGMAFLTSHVRERIDESRTAVSEQLLAQVCPAQLRPYPSATVLELRPNDWRQRGQTIPAGATVQSGPVGASGVECVFQLTRGAHVHPLEVASLTASETHAGGTRLRLELRAQGSTPIGEMGLADIDFFVHADPSLAVALYALLTDTQARLAIASDPREAAHDCGGRLRFEPIGQSAQGGILPQTKSGHLGLDRLQDYFCFRERYLFLRLTGLDRVDLSAAGQRLRIDIDVLGTLPTGHQLGADNLRPFCVPAVNLYPTEAEPVELDHRRSEYRLLADADRPDEVAIYAVDNVSTRGQRSGKVTELWPLNRLRRSEGRRYYHATRHNHGTSTQHTYLQVGGGERVEPETLSARVQVCNGHLPRRHLNMGDIREPGDDIPKDVIVRNIVRPSKYFQPPDRAHYPARLHGFLTASVSSLADREQLQRLLHLMNWSDRKENARRIEAIESAEVVPVNRVHGGLLHRGLELRLEIGEKPFLSLYDIRVFGDVLHAYFATCAAVNEFVALRITTQPSQQELSWSPRTGQSSPI